MRRLFGAEQQRIARFAEIAREQHGRFVRPFRELQEDAGRAQDMAGVDEGRTDAFGQCDRLVVSSRPSKTADGVERIDQRVQRNNRAHFAVLVVLCLLRLVAGVFLLQMGGVDHHQPGQLRGRRRGDDLAAKSPLGEQRQPAAMIEMGMGQEDIVDAGRGGSAPPGPRPCG